MTLITPGDLDGNARAHMAAEQRIEALMADVARLTRERDEARAALHVSERERGDLAHRRIERISELVDEVADLRAALALATRFDLGDGFRLSRCGADGWTANRGDMVSRPLPALLAMAGQYDADPDRVALLRRVLGDAR